MKPLKEKLILEEDNITEAPYGSDYSKIDTQQNIENKKIKTKLEDFEITARNFLGKTMDELLDDCKKAGVSHLSNEDEVDDVWWRLANDVPFINVNCDKDKVTLAYIIPCDSSGEYMIETIFSNTHDTFNTEIALIKDDDSAYTVYDSEYQSKFGELDIKIINQVTSNYDYIRELNHKLKYYGWQLLDDELNMQGRAVENLKEDTVVDQEQTGKADTKVLSKSTMVSEMIKGEWDAIDLYNSMIGAFEEDGDEKAVKLINDIVKEEYVHVGELEHLLSLINENSNEIDAGVDEASELIGGTDDGRNN